MISFAGIPEEDLLLFQEHIGNKVLMQRAQAIVRQKRAARAARAIGGQAPIRGKHGQLISMPKANIDPAYYFSRMGQEREASEHRLRTNENIWNDPDFLPWELKRNPELRPVIQEQNKPVHMSGLIVPGTDAEFKKAKQKRSD